MFTAMCSVLALPHCPPGPRDHCGSHSEHAFITAICTVSLLNQDMVRGRCPFQVPRGTSGPCSWAKDIMWFSMRECPSPGRYACAGYGRPCALCRLSQLLALGSPQCAAPSQPTLTVPGPGLSRVAGQPSSSLLPQNTPPPAGWVLAHVSCGLGCSSTGRLVGNGPLAKG